MCKLMPIQDDLYVHDNQIPARIFCLQARLTSRRISRKTTRKPPGRRFERKEPAIKALRPREKNPEHSKNTAMSCGG